MANLNGANLRTIFLIFALFTAPFFAPFFNAANLAALDFSKCQEYYLRASKIFATNHGEIRAIHLGRGDFLAFSAANLEGEKIAKKDAIIGLYLFKDSALPARFVLKNERLNIPLVALNLEGKIEGKITRKQASIEDLGEFSVPMPPNAALSDICYQVYGLSAGGQNFIATPYLRRFLNAKSTAHAQLSFEVAEKNGEIIVSASNPLLDSPLQNGDVLLSINGANLANLGAFKDLLATLSPSDSLSLKIKRNGEILEVSTQPKPRTTKHKSSFLDAFGLVVSEDLEVLQTPQISPFQEKDRILKINKTPVKNIAEMNAAIAASLRELEPLRLLVSRKNFEFFITLKDNE